MNKKIASIAVASSLAVSLSAFASTGPAYNQSGYDGDWANGWYIGAGVNGDSQAVMDSNSGVDVFGLASDTVIDRRSSDLGFDVYVGRQVSDWFAGELGFTWVGDQKFRVRDADTRVKEEDITVKDQWNIHLVGVGHLPLGDYVGVFAKLGAAYLQSDTRYKDATLGTSETESTHGFALTYGVGLQVSYEQFGIRGEYNVYRPANNVRDDFYISDVISANVFYKFM
jgi:hypothetical protein